MNKFKAGDKVYCPHISTQVFQLNNRSGRLVYPLGITYYDDDGTKKFISFTLDGFEFKDNKTPQIFHATPEMKAKLEDLYGIKLEKPPTKPTSKDIIKARLNKSTKPVPCWVSNDPNCTQPTCKNKWVFIKDCDDGRFSKFPYLDSMDKYWMHATPFNPHTNEAITELPE